MSSETFFPRKAEPPTDPDLPNPTFNPNSNNPIGPEESIPPTESNNSDNQNNPEEPYEPIPNIITINGGWLHQFKFPLLFFWILFWGGISEVIVNFVIFKRLSPEMGLVFGILLIFYYPIFILLFSTTFDCFNVVRIDLIKRSIAFGWNLGFFVYFKTLIPLSTIQLIYTDNSGTEHKKFEIKCQYQTSSGEITRLLFVDTCDFVEKTVYNREGMHRVLKEKFHAFGRLNEGWLKLFYVIHHPEYIQTCPTAWENLNYVKIMDANHRLHMRLKLTAFFLITPLYVIVRYFLKNIIA